MSSKIKLLIPDLPSSDDILPWLKQIDQNQWYSNFGPLVKQFEQGLARELQRVAKFELTGDHLTTCSSGTSALVLAIKSLQLPAGSNILLPSFTFPATALAILEAGHQPVFTEIDEESWLLTPQIALDVVKRQRIDAVIPVAALGNPVDSELWDNFFNKTEIPVVVDAAAAFGHQTVGKQGIYTFSFHATKSFAIGEGGLIVSAKSDVVEKSRRMSNFGFDSSEIIIAGTNAKLSEYHAAVGLAQLQRWKSLKIKKHQLWKQILNAIQEYQLPIKLQKILCHDDHFTSTFCLKLEKDAQAVVNDLHQNQIETRRWYSPGVHKMPVFSSFKTAPRFENKCSIAGKELNITDELTNRLLGIPFHQELSVQDITTLMNALKIALN